MRPHQLGNRRNVITLSLLASLILGAIFMFAPMSSIAAARQALATRLNASPTAKRIMSIAPAPVRNLVRRQFEPVDVTAQAAVDPISLIANPSLNSLGEPVAAMAVASFTQSVTPSPVCAGSIRPGGGSQSVDYVFTVTNDAIADTGIALSITLPAGFNIVQGNIGGFAGFVCPGFVGTNTFSCGLGNLAASAVGTIGLSVFIPAGTAAGVHPPLVAASYSSVQTPPIAPTGSANVTVQTCTDLGITKATGNANPVAGGGAFSYTLVVTNHGPAAAADVVVTDPLPASVIFQNLTVANASGGNLSCVGPPVGTNGVVQCTSGSFPSGAVSTVSITAQIAPATAAGVRFNTATVVSATTEMDPNAFPNSASVQQDIVVTAPLSITKAGPASVCAGDTYTYHITVLNGGSSTALNATISDPLPANTTFLSQVGTAAFANTCSHNGGSPGTVTCASVDIPSGLSTLDITVRLAANAPTGPLPNVATINTAGTGSIAVGSSTTTATVRRCADLEITKTASPGTVNPGQDINYTINVKNNGPSDIAGPGEFQVTDVLPPVADAPFKPGTVINAPGFSCNGLTAVAASFPCVYAGSLAVGASVEIKFILTVNPAFNGGLPGGSIVNTASVGIPLAATNVVDNNSQNNSSTATTPVLPSADLSIGKTALTVAGGVFGAAVTAGGGVTAGFGVGSVGLGEIEYTLTYGNSGPGDAANVHIRDVIPGGTLLVPSFVPTPVSVVVTPASGPGLTCQILPTLNEYQLDCTPNTPNGVLPNGSNGTIQFSVRVPENVLAGTVIRNQAHINSEQDNPPQAAQVASLAGRGVSGASLAQQNPATPDPNGGNNTSQETQNVVRAIAELSIVKTGPAAINAGQPIQYLLTVANNGISDAHDVVIKDILPPGVQFLSATSSDADFVCTFLNGTLSCQAALLAAPPLNAPPLIPVRVENTSVVITVNAFVTPGVANGTVLDNEATVESSVEDPVLANNESHVMTTVTSTSTVTITKVANPNPVIAGTNLTYTLTVENQGPSNAQGVVVTDPLPAETVFVSATGTGVFAAPGACIFTPGAPVGTVTCTPPGGVLPAGAGPSNPSIITITVHIPSGAVGPTIGPNTATVVWTNPAGSTASSAAVTVALAREADLQVDKTCAPTAIAGQNLDCTIKIKNNGPSDVKGNPGAPGEPPTPAVPGSVVITDLFPAGANYVSVQVVGAGGFTCSFAAPLLTCLNAAGAPGNIPVGGEATLIVKSTTPSNAPAGSNFCDEARIFVNPILHPDPDPLDPNLTNNVDTACAVVVTSADLVVSKTSIPVVDPDGAGPLAPVALPIVGPNVPPGSVNAGGYIRYDVPFGNSGSSDAINVLLNNVIPGNTAFVGALATGGVFVPAAQPPAVPFVFTIAATDVVAPLGPAINFVCTVIGAAGSQQIFCVPQDNDAVVPPYADGVLPAGYSGQLTFFVKVNESVTGGSIITDPAIITSGLCPNGPGPVPPTWPPVPCPGTPDANTSNNISQITENVVVASSNLSISKIVQSAVTSVSSPNQTGPIGPATAPNGAGLTGFPVVAGTVMTYRVTITNTGPSDVSNIRLTDLLPSGLEAPPGRVLGVRYISVNPVLPSGATFTCAPPTGINPANNPQGNGGSIVCTAPLLAANAPNNVAAIDITVFIDAATRASLVNTATVDATINNFNRPVSGTAVLTTPVLSRADLALTKTHAPDPVIAGTEFNYTVTLTNNGQSAAHNVSLVDTLPPFQKVTNIAIQQSPNGNGAPNFSCVGIPPIGSAGDTTSVTCSAAELPPNKNADGTVNPAGTVVFTIRVLQSASTPQPTPTSYLNCVTATTTSTDPTPANNTNICDTVNISFVADPDTLTLKKVDSPDPVIAGNLLTYVITATNNGPSAALNFLITDPLPANVRFVSAVASPGATLVTPAIGATGLVTSTWDAAGGTPGGLTAVGVVRTLTIVVRVCPDVLCNTVISNTATSTSLTLDGRVNNDSDTAETLVQSRSDLSISKSDSPDPVKPSTAEPSPIDSLLTYTLNFSNAGPSNSANTIITDVLPAGFTIVSTSSTVPGTIFTPSVGGSTGDQITLTINLGVLGAANQCNVPARPTSGTVTIVVRIPNKFPNGPVTNTATISSGNCLPDPNPGNNVAIEVTEVSQEPQGGSDGLAFPARAEASDDKSGSVLFFPHYTSDASVPAQQNTTISITNTGIFDNAVVHLFVVDGATCSAQDVYICLTRNQTVSFLASDFDPGVTGYIVAVAVNPISGRPISFNCLVGDAYVKHSTGHKTAYGAVAVSTLLNNPAGVDPLSSTALLKFDGVHYNRLPRILAVDGIASPGEGSSTKISLMAVGGNLSQSGATIGSLTGNLFDDRENNFSFNEPAPNCTFTRTLTDSFPRTFTPFGGVIPPGHSGWMKIRAFSDIAILGVMLTHNPNVANAGNAFSNGHGLHGLTLTTASTLIIPVNVPECR